MQALGPAHVMAALFIEQSGNGLPPGVESATAFVWTRMAYAEWVEVARQVLAAPHAWYPLMWFCHRHLRIDYFAMVRSHALASEARIGSQERDRPTGITIIRVPDEDTMEWELIRAAGRHPPDLWRELRAQGASAGEIDEAGRS